MSRRESKEDKKAQRQKKKEDRKVAVKNELQRVILACEGSVTEKNYFQVIFNDLIQNKGIAKTSLVIAKHKHTDPKGVLQDTAIAHAKKSIKSHSSENNSLNPSENNPSTTVYQLVEQLHTLKK
ncbi:MAG: hypothetical protein U9P72_05225 [Campylobacterota bacterium]|nr:hypothetical protein [Campylobacterota bacterium]